MNRFKMLRVINLKLHWFRTLHFAITTDFGPISYEGSLICRLSCETKQYPIRKRADKDGSITNIVMARVWALSLREGGISFFFFSNLIYSNLYISPGLMFCFLVIF